LTRRAFPDFRYSWMVASLSKALGDRRRNVTVEPWSVDKKETERVEVSNIPPNVSGHDTHSRV
jgi:hypothetical protein